MSEQFEGTTIAEYVEHLIQVAEHLGQSDPEMDEKLRIFAATGKISIPMIGRVE
jgi:hypothetical protein